MTVAGATLPFGPVLREGRLLHHFEPCTTRSATGCFVSRGRYRPLASGLEMNACAIAIEKSP